jgi:uncharacterized protein (DUF433 family)
MGGKENAMRWQDHIEQRPEVMLGKPVIKGTRLTVELILERLGQGATDSDLLDAYPHLKPEHIRAVQAYAAAVVANDDSIYASEPTR